MTMNEPGQTGQTVSPDTLNRARGALLGLAVGDAIGTTVEFEPRGSFAPLTDMVGGGPFDLLPGQWTDDTSMALCLTNSLLENGFDLQDQMQRHVRWHDEGYLSSNGRCFDIGMATSSALGRFQRTGNPVAGSHRPDSAGNGSLMRLAPVPIHYLDTPGQAIALSAVQSTTTHQAPECLCACRLLAEVLIRHDGGHCRPVGRGLLRRVRHSGAVVAHADHGRANRSMGRAAGPSKAHRPLTSEWGAGRHGLREVGTAGDERQPVGS